MRIRFRASDFALVAKIKLSRAKSKQASCGEMMLGSFFFLFERSEFPIDTCQKKSPRVCPCAACTCQIILVLVCGITYHIRTYLVSARYQLATKIRICRYICARVGYVLCATYVPKLVWARFFVPGICRLPRYVYVGTCVPGLHLPPQTKNRRPRTGSGSDTRTARQSLHSEVRVTTTASVTEGVAAVSWI